MWYNLLNSAQTAQEKRKGYSMKIVLVGGGKVGTALARQLSEEGHNVTVIDTNKARVEHIGESYDVMSILGNGSSITTLSEAGVEEADVFIAVTGSDELNLLCCMFAKKAGHCHAIARVRNPSYSHELDFIKKQIGISAIINPEMAAAKEISHLLRFPGASKIDTFAGGRVRLIKFALTEQQGLDGVAIHEIPTRLKSDILVCAVERDGGVIIPNGNFVLQNGDQVTFLATQEKAHEFFQRINMPVRPVRNALIVGGGAIAYYLSQELLENHVRVRIVERDPARCNVLAESLPEAQILNEDGSNRDFLLSEGLESTEAFVALTNIDEENVLLTAPKMQEAVYAQYKTGDLVACSEINNFLHRLIVNNGIPFEGRRVDRKVVKLFFEIEDDTKRLGGQKAFLLGKKMFEF